LTSEAVGPADLVDPERLPACVPIELYDGCVELSRSIAYLTERRSGLDEPKPRVAITGSPSIVGRLHAAEAGIPLIVIPLGLLARAYTLALVLEAHDGGVGVELVGDEDVLLDLAALPPGLAAIFDPSGTALWERLAAVQSALGVIGAGAAAAARETARLAAAFFICHEIAHWARMHDVARLATGDVGVGRVDLDRGIELGADGGAAQMLTTLVGQYPWALAGRGSLAQRWDAQLYALAVAFALLAVEPHDPPPEARRIYHHPVIRHAVCLDVALVTVESRFPDDVERWRQAESGAWRRYRSRFAAVQAAAMAGRFGGVGLSVPYDVLSWSGSPDLLGTLEQARALHNRVGAVLPELLERPASAEFDDRFDDSALHDGTPATSSVSVGAALHRRWQEGAAGSHPVGAAMISVVVDLQVAGYHGPISHDDVDKLYPHYLPHGAPRPDQVEYEAELDWAYRAVGGAGGCIAWVNFSTFMADPALLALVSELSHARTVPHPVRRWAIAHIDDPSRLLALAARAGWERDLDIADAALDKAARYQPEIGQVLRRDLAELRAQRSGGVIRPKPEDTDALDGGELSRLGLAYLRAGDLDRAEELLRPPAVAGLPAALCNMGLLEERRGRIETARRWWERAADGGDVRAMNNLGAAALTGGDLAAAAHWFTDAAEAGDLLALYNLGSLAHEQGDAAGAESWWRVAADSGITDAMVELGRLLAAQGRDAEAAVWWSECATTAGRQLVADHALRDERLALGETLRQWEDRISHSQEAGSIKNYGIMLTMSGRTADGIRQLELARDAGDPGAADMLHRIGWSAEAGRPPGTWAVHRWRWLMRAIRRRRARSDPGD
jgi:TPR repeat protein